MDERLELIAQLTQAPRIVTVAPPGRLAGDLKAGGAAQDQAFNREPTHLRARPGLKSVAVTGDGEESRHYDVVGAGRQSDRDT